MKPTLSILIISCLFLTTACSQTDSKNSTAEMTFKGQLDYNFGKIPYDSEGTHEFVFKNTGKEALVITNVKSSCGCTIPTYSNKPVEHKKTGKISVKYDTKRTGQFHKTITVYSNAKNSPVLLHISGEVLSPQRAE
ncbi:MAG: hypothetical protein CSB06_02465 [Bacteroidia bacterium]|nr:MAG: hypothetical protein CSB06_02465 [Bacteroidia bacterium]